MKGLYLAESEGLELRAHNGSLLVRQPGRAPWYVPPRRVDRAVFWGGVLVDSAAIGLLLEHGVQVSFVSRSGEIQGIAWPREDRYGKPAGLVERRRADPEWVDAFRRLLDAWVREARLDLVRRRDRNTWSRWVDSGFRTPDWDRWRRDRLFSGMEGPGLDAPWRFLKSLIWTSVSGWLLDEGFDPHRGVLDARRRLGLVREMSRPLVPWIDETVSWGVRCGLVGKGYGRETGGLKPAAVRRWTARFEGHRDWMEGDVRRRAHQLFCLARDWQPDTVRSRGRRR